MRHLMVVLVCLGCSFAALAQEAGPGHARTVREFVAAANRQDVEAMIAATQPDFRWIQIVGDRASTEVVGHTDLRSWLESYFASTPGAHAEIGPVAVHGNFASTIETASWTRKDGTRAAQSATSVYEFADDGRIRHVWYFSAQAEPGQDADPP